jgi:hypothetical protein
MIDVDGDDGASKTSRSADLGDIRAKMVGLSLDGFWDKIAIFLLSGELQFGQVRVRPKPTANVRVLEELSTTTNFRRNRINRVLLMRCDLQNRMPIVDVGMEYTHATSTSLDR